MPPEVVAEVGHAMVELDPRLSGGGSVEELYRAIALDAHRKKGVRACDTTELAALLTNVFGRQNGETVLSQILERRLKDHPFLVLEERPPMLIARILAQESSAVSALVLGHLAPATSATVLGLLEDKAAFEIVRRMATLRTPPTTVLHSIATKLEERAAALALEGDEPDPSERLRSIAELLNNSTPTIEKGAIDTLAEEDAEMAAELREYMFTWDDISTIDKRAMQKILGTVDTKTLSIALKACSTPVEENVMENLSSRVREMVGEERELAGAVPMSEVVTAREEIMKNIRALIESGEFRPSRAGEDLVS